MASANPFGNLRVQRDDDDEPQSNTQKAQQEQQQLFVAPAQEPKKKKKVRPEKKEEHPVVEEEGFEIVGSKKNKPKQKRQDETYEDEQQGPKKDKYSKKERTGDYHIKEGSKPIYKRQYDKHSGTGRGKEISKGGAGGKGTWLGNKNQEEYEYNNDDYYIENALNPKTTEKDYSEKHWDKKREDKTSQPKTEEKVEEGATEQKAEETKEEGKFKGKKKKEKEEKEVKQEDLLIVPEDAITADEYLKQKEKKRIQEIQVSKPKETEALEIVAKEEKNEFGLSGTGKKNKKQKEKKKTETKTVIANVQFEDVNQKRGYYKKNYEKKDNKGFQFNPDECPKISK